MAHRSLPLPRLFRAPSPTLQQPLQTRVAQLETTLPAPAAPRLRANFTRAIPLSREPQGLPGSYNSERFPTATPNSFQRHCSPRYNLPLFSSLLLDVTSACKYYARTARECLFYRPSCIWQYEQHTCPSPITAIIVPPTTASRKPSEITSYFFPDH